MKKIIYLALVFLNAFLFGAESDSLSSGKVYVNSNGFNINQTCSPVCRAVQAPYKTKVVDFNPYSGITKCIIINAEQDESNEFSFVADTYNQQCVTSTSNKVDVGSLTSYGKSFNSNPTLTYENKASLSKIFTALATLDDDVIDITQTINSNKFTLKSGALNYASNNTFNSLNNANLGFFVNLFYGFQKVYLYVQYFLFIFVGAFFLTIYIWNMAVNKIGKTGEKEKINKLIVPLVMIIFCFIPIQKENGITTTPIQNIIQYFMQTSNGLADRISVSGAESYLKKLHTTVGADNVNKELYLAERVKNLQAGVIAYKKAYSNCKDRFELYYDDYKSFQTKDEELIKKAEEMSPGASQDYSFAGCRKIEADLLASERELIDRKANLQGIKTTLSSNELQSLLTQLRADMQEKSNNLGWYYTAFITSISVVVENLSEISSSSVQNEIKERNIDLDKNYNIDSTNEYITESQDGGFMGSLAYFMLPGAQGIYTVIKETGKSSGLTNKKIKAVTKGLKELPIIGFLGGAADVFLTIAENIAAVFVVQAIYSTILTYLPLMVGIVAGFIAIGSYIIELLKYFYVAPFTVTYAITQQRQNKIIDFFVDGIAIWLKPMLITICVLLSIFIYYLFTELFMGLVMLNFDFFEKIDNSNFNFINGLTLATFSTAFFIIVSIATAFIMFQLVVNGSKAFLTLIGLQDKDNLSSSLSHRIDRHTFQV